MNIECTCSYSISDLIYSRKLLHTVKSLGPNLRFWRRLHLGCKSPSCTTKRIYKTVKSRFNESCLNVHSVSTSGGEVQNLDLRNPHVQMYMYIRNFPVSAMKLHPVAMYILFLLRWSIKYAQPGRSLWVLVTPSHFLFTPAFIFTCSASAGQCLITVVVVLVVIVVVGKNFFKIEA